jgi:hypothetical protein
VGEVASAQLPSRDAVRGLPRSSRPPGPPHLLGDHVPLGDDRFGEAELPDSRLTYVRHQNYDYVDATGRRLEFVGADDAFGNPDSFASLEKSIQRHVITRQHPDVLVIDATAASPEQLQAFFAS